MSPFPDDIRDTAQRAARDAHHAAREASRAAHRATFRARCSRGAWFFPTLLIGMGVIFLLDNLDIIESRYILRDFWPMLVLAFGLSRLVSGVGGERVFGAIATFFGGFWLAERVFDLDINVMGIFWPLILIGVGISMLYGPKRGWNNPPFDAGGPPVPPMPGTPAPPSSASFTDTQSGESQAPPGAAPESDHTDQSARLKETAFLASVERRNVSQVFRGGELTAFLGGIEIDLRDCRMVDPTATIAIQVFMGQVILRLPPNWTVQSHLGTFVGNFEDRSDRPVDANPKRLLLYGSVFMGQVEIRN